MKLRLACAILLGLGLLICLPNFVSADIIPEPETDQDWQKRLFEKYWNLQDRPQAPKEKAMPEPAGPPAEPGFPGIIAEGWTTPPNELFHEKWPYRAVTYELYFPTTASLGRTVYGLAIFTKDLKPSVTLERFEKGAGGFHYSIGQLVDWANAVAEGRQQTYTREEDAFLARLVRDKVMIKVNGRYRDIGMVRHVLGVTPQKKRSVKLNADHERLHVLWDEDREFREKHIKLWQGLSREEKDVVIRGLKGYNPENEMQMIEEWSVRQNESDVNWPKAVGEGG